MSKKEEKAGMMEAAVSTALDKVADAAIDKVKAKISSDAVPAVVGKAVDHALDNVKDAALDKAKTELKAVAVKHTKKIAKKALRRGVALVAVAGCAVIALKNKDAIISFVKEKIG